MIYGLKIVRKDNEKNPLYYAGKRFFIVRNFNFCLIFAAS